MKILNQLPVILILLLVCSCNSNKNENDTKSEATAKKNFDFLIGQWDRTNEEKGKSTFEAWKKENDSTYVGNSFTLKGKDTIWGEDIKLSPVNGIWYMQVSMPNKKEVTMFKLIKDDKLSFICENQQNEFPKTISYQKSDQGLNAEISDGKTTIPYIYKGKR